MRAPSERSPRPKLQQPQLVVIARPATPLRALTSAALHVGGAPAPAAATRLATLLRSRGAALRPLFGVTEERVAMSMAARVPAAHAHPATDYAAFYQVDAPTGDLKRLAEELRQTGEVLCAYVKPPAEPAAAAAVLNRMAASPQPPPPTTPDFTARQGYLEAAPGGVDARFAWQVPGGRGQGVRVIDLEWAWRLSHEDLQQNSGGLVGGSQFDDVGVRNHGTAVIGVIGADRNGFGVTGIAPEAAVSVIAFGEATAASIRQAADKLSPGDIMLLEIHRPGPRHNFEERQDQLGYVAVEWWPDDFAAIRYAVGRGIIVVEAAGNGAEDLDDALYDTPDAGFPDTWTNPYRRGAADSGAILVGAGAPPPGTHGADHGADRSRLDFSNYAAAIDAQGWGREVTSTGYGDLQGGGEDFEDVWYTDEFAGTSSASPVVVGALACVQGALRAAGRPLLTPDTARELVRSTGSAQQDADDAGNRPRTERIGNRPDVRAMLARLGLDQPPVAPGGGRAVASELSLRDVPGGSRVTITITVDTPRAGG